jgi:hypothetical protein
LPGNAEPSPAAGSDNLEEIMFLLMNDSISGQAPGTGRPYDFRPGDLLEFPDGHQDALRFVERGMAEEVTEIWIREQQAAGKVVHRYPVPATTPEVQGMLTNLRKRLSTALGQGGDEPKTPRSGYIEYEGM